MQYYAKAETLFGVPAAAFYPAPKVDSAVLQLIPHPAPPVAPKSPQKMFDTIRAAFSQRRKTAANAISAGLQIEKAAVEQALATLQIPAATRPEQLSLQQFSDLATGMDQKIK